MLEKIQIIKQRFDEVNDLIIQPDIISDQKRYIQLNKEYKDLLERMQKELEGKAKEVRVSHRLTNSPSCLVVEEDEMAVNLQNILKQAGQAVPTVQPILEINSDHTLVQQLKDEQDDERFSNWTSLLFDQALLSEGGQLEDPAAFVSRMNDLLLYLSK